MSSQKTFRKNAAGFLLIVVCCLSLYVALPAGTAGNDGIISLTIIRSDFQLSVFPNTRGVTRNQKAVFYVTVSAIGLPEYVTLSVPKCAKLPASCNLSPSSGNTPYDATLTVTLTGPWAGYEAGATYLLDIGGTSSSGQIHVITVGVGIIKPG